jgi:ribonuclease R
MRTIINYKNNGNAYVEVEGERYFVFKYNAKPALPGDTVEVELIRHRKKVEAKVKKVIERAKTKFVGTVEKFEDHCLVTPIRYFGVDFKVKKKHCEIDWNDIHNGEKVVVEFMNFKGDNPRGKIVEILGESFDNEVEMNAIVIEYGFDTKFPDEVMEEAEKVSDKVEVTNDRTDMRNVTTFTIDPETAKDFDDALSIEKVKNGYIIGVHIADVSHYVKENSAIDKEAIKRATSVYLVDRTIPMLPERLSNGLCSLNPNVDRYAFSVMFDMAESGRVRNYWLQNSVINSDRRYTYDEALKIIEGKEDQYSQEMRALYELSLKLREKRDKDNIKMKRKEAKFKIDENGKPLEIFFKEATASTQLIEEFMLLANKHVGLEFHKKGHTFIWRNHDEPNPEKLMNLENYLELIGEPYKIRENNAKKDLNVVLKRLEGSYLHETVSSMVMRSMAKAKYSSVNIGHYGLGFRTYSHFTSPIRRYPDLIAHRILKKYLTGKIYNYPSLEDRCTRCNAKEVQAQKAERDSIRYKQTEYMEQFIGQEMEGNVSYIMSNRVFVILDNGIEGSFPVSFNKDSDEHKAIVDGYEITIGTRLTVEIESTDLFRKDINLKVIF